MEMYPPLAGPWPRPRRRLAGAPPAAADPAPWLRVLSASILAPADVDLLMRLAHRRTVAAGDAVLDRSAPAHALVLLLSGDVVLGSRAADGSLRTERSVTGPAWLDVSAAWLGQPHAMEAQALSDVVVADLPLDAVRDQMSIHPPLAQQLAMSPETLSRLMRSFELRGVLSVRGYQVQVRDVDELRALAGTVA